jgi:hypothetical protein
MYQEAHSPLKIWEHRENEIALFNSLDRELLKTSTAPCLVRLLRTQDVLDSVYEDEYEESAIKNYDAPLQVTGSFLPFVDTFEFTIFGGDLNKELTIIFNFDEWNSIFNRNPQPGDLIKTPEFEYVYRISDVQKLDPVFYGRPMHYQVKGVLDDDAKTKYFNYGENELEDIYME